MHFKQSLVAQVGLSSTDSVSAKLNFKINPISSLAIAKHSILSAFFSISLFASAVLYAPYVAAETTVSTNVSDVQIEIVDEPVSGDLVRDPIQALITDKDANDNNQEDLWGRIKDGYAMPDVESAYASKHEEWYASRPDM